MQLFIPCPRTSAQYTDSASREREGEKQKDSSKVVSKRALSPQHQADTWSPPTSCRHFTSFSFQPSLKFSTAHFEGSTGPISLETYSQYFSLLSLQPLVKMAKYLTRNWVRLFSLFVKNRF